MELTAKRKHVLKALKAYEYYKLCAVLMTFITIGLFITSSLMVNRIVSLSVFPRIVSIILFGSSLMIGIFETIRMIKGLLTGSKMYIQVSDCYLRFENQEETLTCRQITKDGETEFIVINKEDVSWILPGKTPGFYVRLKDECILGDRSEISTGKRIAYILGSAYDLSEFSAVYEDFAKELEERSKERVSKWQLPDRKKELFRIFLVGLMYIISFLWVWISCLFSASVALTVYVLMGIIGVLVFRRYEKSHSIS